MKTLQILSLFASTIIFFFLLNGLSSCAPLPEIQIHTPPPMPASETVDVVLPTKPEKPEHVPISRIQAVRLFPEGEPIEEPIISLGSGRLTLHFDEIDSKIKTYRYTVVHCNRDWKKSDLEPYEYVDGFETADITEYDLSSANRQRFVHYTATLPNEYFKLTKSGNYILTVFNDDQSTKKPAFEKRFQITESGVSIEGEVFRPSLTAIRNTNQGLRFRVKPGNLSQGDPFSTMNVTLLQNGRWDNAKTEIKPQFVRNEELIYEDPGQTFPAGKEFRYFNIRSLGFLTERIASVNNSQMIPDVNLVKDEIRVYKNYRYVADMNGNWFCEVDNANAPELEAEFSRVYFELPYPAPIPDGELYLFGKLTNYEFNEVAKLKYDFDSFSYKGSLLLKQGFYNYAYAFLPDKSDQVDLAVIDGNWFETENKYTILVYLRDFEGNYDRLVGTKVLSSVND